MIAIAKARYSLPLLLTVVLAGCTGLNQERGPDPVTLRLESLERRLDAIERILANGSLVDLTLQVDELERQTAELRGRLEQSEYSQTGSADRQRSLYTDLDERLQALEAGYSERSRQPLGGGGTAGAGVSDLPVPGGSDQQNYQAAFDLLRDRRYDEAVDAFAAFTAAFPDSALIDNGQYWLAESYYVTSQFERALAEFQTVVNAYPRSRKVPDALLKIGFCQYELDRWPEARVTLSRVSAEFPGSSAANLAADRIARMDQESR